MKKSELTAKVTAVKSETREALQTIYDALNQGQQKKLLSNAVVAKLLERYGVSL